jgi:hypothetical protein
MREKIGLWLARTALRLTRNPELARASGVLPLIVQRRLAIFADPVDQGLSDNEGEGSWAIWNRPSPPPLLPRIPE